MSQLHIVSACDYVGPCQNVAYVPTTAQPFGYTPFDIQLLSWGLHYYAGDQSTQMGRPWVNGVAYDPSLIAPDGGGSSAAFDTPLVIPKVVETNVDGAARWGVQLASPAGSDRVTAAFEYSAVNDGDVGKIIMGIGQEVNPFGTAFVDSPVAGNYGQLIYSANVIWGGIPSFFFLSANETYAELVAAGQQSGPNPPPAGWPWLVPGTFQDFMLIVHDPGGPSGTFTFQFRQNQSSVVVISTTASAQRVWTPAGDPVISVNDGDLINWLCSAAPAPLGAALIWSFRPSTATAGMPFGGPFGGSF